MSRLIDADKIIDSLGNSDMDFVIGAVIDEQPTVFDMDKVVEQLDIYITKLVGRNSALYQTVMQIVKGGGVE
nr:MAG TPA: hypothetical protein [Caudoviricetes sp.]